MESSKIEKADLADFTWESREEGFSALEHEVIYRELCSGCGLCVAVCPEKVIGFTEYPKLIGRCTNCGYCLMLCPRSFLPKDEAEAKKFGKTGETLGVVEKIYSIKAKDKGQDGGFVTALLKFLLKEGKIDGAVVSGLDEGAPWKPLPKIARSSEEIEAAAGSRYSTSPNLSVLKAAREEGLKRLAIVGTPCHMDGLAKMENYPVRDVDLQDLRAYSISVFCKSNFIYPMITNALEKERGIDLTKVDKFDIKGKNILVYEAGIERKVPLKDVHEYVRLGCKVCDDFTGRFTDFAVGSVDSPAGHSTVIARTKEADKVVQEMIKKGLIEATDVTGDDLPVMHKLSEIKKKGARKAIKEIVRQELPLPLKYLGE